MTSPNRRPQIPALAHFIWLGTNFPWTHWLALRSAADRGGFARVVCHHEPGVVGQPWFEKARSLPGVEMRVLEPHRLWALLEVEGLESVYRDLTAPAARSNILRLALLATEGGVYLDFDTVTVGSLDPIRELGGFVCGVEPLAYPGWLRAQRWSVRLVPSWCAAFARAGLRQGLTGMPNGWAWFRRFASWYPIAANNAVLAAVPDHPLTLGMLAAAARMPAEQRRRRFALGTHLLQRESAGYRGDDLTLLAPDVCYPLGPVLAQHWFRCGSERRSADLGRLIRPNTRVVHWYASGDVDWSALDPVQVTEMAPRQFFSALARTFL